MSRRLLNRSPARWRALRAGCALAVAVVLSTACATFMNGPTQRVAVASNPPGARVFVGDEPVGVTPAFVELERDEGDLALRFEKDCYRDALLEVPRRTSAWARGNLVPIGFPFNEVTWGGWLGMNLFFTAIRALVDWGTGSAFAFPNVVRATLERLPGRFEAADFEVTDRAVKGSGEGVEPDGGCAPGASAGAGDQGNTPSDR